MTRIIFSIRAIRFIRVIRVKRFAFKIMSKEGEHRSDHEHSQKRSENKVIEILAKRFKLPLEQARDLVIAYRLSGSCDEGIMGMAQATGISLKIVMDVFYSLDDLAALVKEENDIKKWWKTGEM